MATREQILAEIQRRGLSAPAALPAAQPITTAAQPGKEAILAEIERRGLEVPAQVLPEAAQPLPAAMPSPADVPTEEALALPAAEAEPEPTLGQQLVGAAETGLSALTGATGGSVGMLVGTLEGLVESIKQGKYGTQEGVDIVERRALETAGGLTYEPRTEAGREQVEALGEITAPLVAATPFGAELAAIPALARGAAPQVAQIARKAPEAARAIVRPGRETSVGAQALKQAVVRQELAKELPVPIQLTKGQRERSFEQQRFEKETAKLEVGEPLRERFADQNIKVQQNIDEFIDRTGAQALQPRDVGMAVDRSLRNRMATDKKKIRNLYQKAEEGGEMEDPVTLSDFVNHLNESAPEAEVANVLRAVRGKAIKLGAATEGPEGELIPQSISLRNSELLRRSINNATNEESTNIRQASIMKSLIDDETSGVGGDLYKRARKERMRLAQNFQNVGIVKRLVGTKRGTEDRQIALENVVNDTLFKEPLDSVRHVRRLLQTSGEEGKQAWKDLQGGALTKIRDQVTGNVQIDQAGNRVVSPAQLDRMIKQLDSGGKLDFIFGKKGAEQLRTLNEIALDIYTAPPGAINYSNTASTIASIMDMMASATTGIPMVPAQVLNQLTKGLKNRAVKKRVQRALD